MKRYLLWICNATIPFTLVGAEENAFLNQLEIEEKSDESLLMQFAESKKQHLPDLLPPADLSSSSLFEIIWENEPSEKAETGAKDAVCFDQFEIEDKTDNSWLQQIAESKKQDLKNLRPPSNSSPLPKVVLENETPSVDQLETAEILPTLSSTELVEKMRDRSAEKLPSSTSFVEKTADTAKTAYFTEKLELEEKSNAELLKGVEKQIAEKSRNPTLPFFSSEDTHDVEIDILTLPQSLEDGEGLSLKEQTPNAIVENQKRETLNQDQPSHEIAAQMEKDNPPPPTYPFLPKRADLRHVQGTGEGIGFGTDYSTAAVMFATEYKLGHIMPMLDLRVHRFDNNTYAANAGVAGRYLPPPDSFCRILGFNLFYDYRQGLNTSNNYHQLGVGVEVLGRKWDFRANIYYPIGSKKHQQTCVFDDFDGGFFMIHRKCEGVSYAFNAEVGYLFTKEQPFLFYGAIGPYYLARRCHDATLGGKARVRPQYKDYLALDLSVSYDSVFKAVFQAEIIVSLPFYQIYSKQKRKGPCGMSDRQVYQPIERFEVMPLGKTSCWEKNF